MTDKRQNTRAYPKRLTRTDDEHLKKIEGWAAQGLTDEEIAFKIGISRRTLYNRFKENEEILESIQEGKGVSDRKVEESLYKKAVGFYEVTERIITTDADGNTVVTEKYKQQTPDTTAIIRWLKNRMPQRWRDKPTPEVVEAIFKDDGFIKALMGTAEDDWEAEKEED